MNVQDLKGWDLDIKNPRKAEEEKLYSSKELIEKLNNNLIKINSYLSDLSRELKK